MKKTDIVIAAICGASVAWIMLDLLGIYGLAFFIIFPALSILGLWVCEILGRKYPFFHQGGKFGLIGAFADVADIKAYQLIFFLLPANSMAIKTVSFLIATAIKYWFNKTWAFEKTEKNGIKKEALQFFAITLVGLAINVASFYYFTKVMGPQFQMPAEIWTELSIIFSALTAAIWNFLGYKFIVFKK